MNPASRGKVGWTRSWIPAARKEPGRSPGCEISPGRAAWALHAPGGSEASPEAFLGTLYHHVPEFGSGARGATNTFVQRGQEDVLLAWEDEASLASKDLGADRFDAVYPPVSIKAEPSVAASKAKTADHVRQP